jgi:zinc protease
MKRALLAMALAAAWAGAQTPPVRKQPPAAGPAGAAQPAAKPAAGPSVKDLKYPPLKPLPVPDVAAFTLPNGLKLYLLEDHELPLIDGVARVRTGNLFDPAGKIGLATLTGMAIRAGGSQAKTGDQWNQELEDMASSVESSIGESSGTVSFSTLKENLDATLGIFKDALTAPEFRQDKIDLAKVEMRSVIARRNDDPRSLAQREFSGIVFGKDTPYGWREEYATLARITRADIQDFYKRYFFPKNVLLAVWGDFDTAEMKSKLERIFADWTVEQAAPPAFPRARTTTDPGSYLAVKRDATQTFFAIGQLGGEARDQDYPALEVMAKILGGGFQSRLIERVRTRMGDAYDIGADWIASFDHPGLFEISGGSKSVSTVETIKAALEEVERIRTAEVSEDELNTAKQTALNGLVFAFDTKSKTLGRMLNYEYFGYPPDFIQQYQKALSGVTRADVLRVAKEHLDPARFTIVAVGNPQAFGQPLAALGGPVRDIDLTIQEPETAPADAASLAKGKQLLERAQQAVGGADKLEAIHDFVETSEVQPDQAAGGMRIAATAIWLAPDSLRQEETLSGRKAVSFLSGRSGWIATPEGAGPLGGAPLKQAQGELFRLYFRLLLSDRMEGRTVNAVDDRTIEISDAAGQRARLAVDPESGMPRGIGYDLTSASGPPVETSEAWSDFRETAGVKIPYRTIVTRNGRKFADVTVTDCKINSGLKLEEMQKRP